MVTLAGIQLLLAAARVSACCHTLYVGPALCYLHSPLPSLCSCERFNFMIAHDDVQDGQSTLCTEPKFTAIMVQHANSDPSSSVPSQVPRVANMPTAAAFSHIMGPFQVCSSECHTGRHTFHPVKGSKWQTSVQTPPALGQHRAVVSNNPAAQLRKIKLQILALRR